MRTRITITTFLMATMATATATTTNTSLRNQTINTTHNPTNFTLIAYDDILPSYLPNTTVTPHLNLHLNKTQLLSIITTINITNSSTNTTHSHLIDI
ncbi:hypothetical protein BO78DRAFT_413733 [Aspergillus sclerotiicarbonarius CBS 121057]|uniref:FAS1 domain-containing protein n=1 Tax=Aspergillus sclerotiicarbonarius (strain CBS 121057 / IBT 28362) TaxID=1448318 RepID=A0A319ELQ7_ASPSB|nr:hypothetical protein BO78DRAFT_413733 [Aspergillus sclerotiicarbonarius CBS 121057]